MSGKAGHLVLLGPGLLQLCHSPQPPGCCLAERQAPAHPLRGWLGCRQRLRLPLLRAPQQLFQQGHLPLHRSVQGVLRWCRSRPPPGCCLAARRAPAHPLRGWLGRRQRLSLPLLLAPRQSSQQGYLHLQRSWLAQKPLLQRLPAAPAVAGLRCGATHSGIGYLQHANARNHIMACMCHQPLKRMLGVHM